MACRCQPWILQQSQQQLQIWDLSSVPAFALPCFCGWLGWAKFLLLRWRTLAHYRGSQSKMCQGIKCLSEKHLSSPASSPAHGCTCLGFMCALFVCPCSHSLAPGAPLSWAEIPAWSRPHSLLSAAQLLFVRENSDQNSEVVVREERGKCQLLLQLFSFNFCSERNWK